MIRILGVDPGLRHTGWGVIAMDGPRLGWIAHGVIKPDTRADMADRLAELLHEAARRHRRTCAGRGGGRGDVRQRQSALDAAARSGSRGALATLATAKLNVAEFAATKVEQSVVGTGAADKTQVAFHGPPPSFRKAGEVSS